MIVVWAAKGDSEFFHPRWFVDLQEETRKHRSLKDFPSLSDGFFHHFQKKIAKTSTFANWGDLNSLTPEDVSSMFINIKFLPYICR